MEPNISDTTESFEEHNQASQISCAFAYIWTLHISNVWLLTYTMTTRAELQIESRISDMY